MERLCRAHGLPSIRAYRYHYGSFGDALRHCGYDPRPPAHIRGQQDRRRTFVPQSSLKVITAASRFRVLLRDGFRCTYCGATPADGAKLVVDHVLPRAAGGANADTNLTTACSACNAGKQDMVINLEHMVTG